MNAVELLKTQHEELRSLFEKIDATEDVHERHDLVGRIVDKLQLHTTLEEETLYPALKSAAPEMVLEAYEEHHVVDLVLGEIPDIDFRDESFPAKMAVLRELVERHADEEEKEMFPLAQRLGERTLAEIAAKMDARIRAGEVTRLERAESPHATAH